MHIGSCIAPALVVRRNCGLLPGEKHPLGHIRIVQRLYRKAKQQLKLCPDGIAGIGGHNQRSLIAHVSGTIQAGIVPIQIGISQF